jgi:DNA-binding CsgD family transcriptional regulator
MPASDLYRPAVAVGGWAVCGARGRGVGAPPWPADGDLSLDATETLAAALLQPARPVASRPVTDREQSEELTMMATSNAPNGSPWSSLRARERERVAVALRVDGCSYAEIGNRLGISDRMASRIVNRAMNRVLRELVDLESARLDALWAAMWPKAMRGSARHAEVCVRISDRRSRLLGLDAPARVNANVLANVTVDQIDAEIERLLEEYRGHAGP